MSTSRIKLLSGGWFDYLDMEQSQYTIDDLSRALSKLCRFNGHVDKPYYVSQHCVIVSHIVPEKYALHGLVHDLAESVMGDMPSPLKMLQPAFKKLEHKVEKYMFEKMGIKMPLPKSIKLADLQVLAAEIRDLQPQSSDWFMVADIEPYPKKIVPWSSEKAHREFMKRYQELTENK